MDCESAVLHPIKFCEFEMEDNCCDVCFELFDGDNHEPKILHCRAGHICCVQCVKKMTASASTNNNSLFEKCVHYGPACDNTLVHFECPFCRDVTHLPRDGIQSLVTFSISSENRRHRFEDRRRIRNSLFLFKDSRQKLDDLIKGVVTNLNEHHYNCNAARLSGAVTGVVGGILAGVGLVLIPFTFGASVGLSIAGGVVGASGAVTSLGSSFVESMIGRSKKAEIEAAVKKSNHQQIDIEDQLRQMRLEQLLKDLSSISCLTKDQLKQFIKGPVYSALSVANVVRSVLQLADKVNDVAGAAASFARLSSVSRVLTIAGGVVGVVLLPLDIFFVVHYSREIHNRTPSELANRLNAMRENLLTERDNFITQMTCVLNQMDADLSIEP